MEEEKKKEFVQVDKADFQTIIDDLNQIQGVVSLAQSVAEEHAGGVPPWCHIEHGLKLAQARIEELIIAICDIEDPELAKIGTGAEKTE